MADDYIWDRTGPVDPEVAALEARLAALRMPEPLRAPVHAPLGPRARPTRSASPWGTIGVAAMTAAATAALIWAWVHGSATEPVHGPASITIDASVHDPGPVSVGTPPPMVASPPSASREPPATERAASSPGPEVPSMATTPAPGAARPVTRKRPARRQESSMPVPSPVAALPHTLTSTDVRKAIAAIKELARACGPAHGAEPGERVIVMISIAGATGLVTSANAVGEHLDTPLGNCVADAFSRATFPRFAKTSMGVQYPITMPD